jgi:hypothetical protein
MKTIEATLNRFRNGNIMLVIRFLRKDRRNVRVYEDYVEICPTEEDLNFMKNDLPLFYYAINRVNDEKRATEKASVRFHYG